jgi:ElaB/YqjD/DUF883 family membrane-anchored ribosome-binding protein
MEMSMTSASTASQTARDAARDTVKDAREAVREVRAAAAEASSDVQSDLQKLRDDFSRLAEQVADILSSKGNAAWRRAKSSVDDAMADAQDKGRDAAEAVREVSENFVDAIDESIKTRPYTTLGIAVALGFLFGAMWRR